MQYLLVVIICVNLNAHVGSSLPAAVFGTVYAQRLKSCIICVLEKNKRKRETKTEERARNKN
jgi:hypothetical protein